jgi:CRISPR-associated protein Csd1
MLLQRLREYAQHHQDTAAFHRDRGFTWALDLDEHGGLVAPRLRNILQEDTKGKLRPTRHSVPTAVRTVGVASNLAADDLQYVLGWADATSKPDRVAHCHAAFADLIGRWAASPAGQLDPVAQAVAAFYRGPGPAAVQREDTFTAKDGVLIMVAGKPAYQAESVVGFWTGEVGTRKGSDRIGICLVCGTIQPLLDTVPGKIPARLVPSATNDAALISVNERVFGYDLSTQLGSSPLCQSCAEDVTAGLVAVLDSRHATGFGGQDSRLAWWLPGQGDDRVVRLLFEPHAEDISELIAAIHQGRPGRRVEGEFCSLTVGGNVARVMVRDWVQMPLATVENNVARWFADHEIVSIWGDDRTHSVGRLVWATGRWHTTTGQYMPFGAKASHRPAGAYRDLIRAAIRGTPLPPDLLTHLVNRVRTDARLDDIRAALLRAALVRSPSVREKPMPDLDETNHDPAYVSGRLFAAYEKLQYDVSGGNLNTTYRDRYFAGALTNPRAALINGARDASAWLKKLRRVNRGAAVNHEIRLDALTGLFDADSPIPARMVPREQALFLIGYHHQRAHQIPKSAASASNSKEIPA